MSKDRVITKSELSAVKYGDLLAKFTELGIKEVWTPGKKKTFMIEAAIAKLNTIKSLEEKGLSDDEVEQEVELIESKRAQFKALSEAKEAEQLQARDDAQRESIVSSGYTKEQLELNLKNIKLNLLQSIPQQRDILLKKQQTLQELLDNI